MVLRNSYSSIPAYRPLSSHSQEWRKVNKIEVWNTKSSVQEFHYFLKLKWTKYKGPTKDVKNNKKKINNAIISSHFIAMGLTVFIK